MSLVVEGGVAGWLRRLGVVRDAELSPCGADAFSLSRDASAEFENGLRLGRLLGVLPGGSSSSLSSLRPLSTPVARLYNWNMLLPELTRRGVSIDPDMKVLIVAGDVDIVVDVLRQLHAACSADGVAGRRADHFIADEPVGALERPADTRSVHEYFAVCLHLQMGCSWAEGLELARSSGLRRLSARLVHGVEGEFEPVVRYLKLAFAHCRHLATLCDGEGGACELALAAMRDGLCSTSADVTLWTSRLLCRLASELTSRGDQAALWPWFSRPTGGTSALLEAWRAHPELHAAGALLPVALHFSGDQLSQFISTVLPQHLTQPVPYFAFALELVPLLSSTKGMHGYMAKSGALEYLLQRALHVARQPNAKPAARGHAIDLLASLWVHFAIGLQAIPLEPLAPPAATDPEDPEGSIPKDSSAIVLAEIKRGCRDPDFELQLTAHMALFRLLDHFAAATHPAAPVLFKVLAFSMIENHHEAVMRQFLARNMQHTLAQQPQIPVGVLLKPLVKQATLYGYNNCDFDFFLVLAKHPRLGLRHALLLMQFLGKVCLNDALHGRVGSIPFLVLVERFHDQEVLHDFLEIFCEQALNKLVPASQNAKSGAETSSIRATLSIELIAKLLHLPHASILKRVAPTVVGANHLYLQQRGIDHPGLAALLRFAQKNSAAHAIKMPDRPQPAAVESFVSLEASHGEENVVPAPRQKKAVEKLPAINQPRRAAVAKAERVERADDVDDIDIPLPPPKAKKAGAGGSYAKAARQTTGTRVTRKVVDADGTGPTTAARSKAPTEEQRRRVREDRLKGSLSKSSSTDTKPRADKPSAGRERAPSRTRGGIKPKPGDTGGRTSKARAPRSPAEKAREALEHALNEADDPNAIDIPAGLAVKVERREKVLHLVPPQLGLGEAVSAVLEVLDMIVDQAVGVHILHPVTTEVTRLRVVPEAAAGAVEKQRAGVRTTERSTRPVRAPRPSMSPPRASTKREARAKPDEQPKSELPSKMITRPGLVPSEAPKRPSPPKRPAPSTRQSPSTKPPPLMKPTPPPKTEPRPRSDPPPKPVRERKPAPPPPALKLRPKPPPPPPMSEVLESSGGPAKETLLMRAEIRKKIEEEERLKKEKERDARLLKRRKETHAKLLEYQEKKLQKEEEKEQKAAAELLAKREEERKQRERDRRRQERNKQKLAEYRKSGVAAADTAHLEASEPKKLGISKESDTQGVGSANGALGVEVEESAVEASSEERDEVKSVEAAEAPKADEPVTLAADTKATEPKLAESEPSVPEPEVPAAADSSEPEPAAVTEDMAAEA